MKRILMVAYHFPPIQESSGMHRTVHFSRYLPEHGWEPTVLTVSPRAYRQTSPDNPADILESVRVVRAPALDTSRHLSLFGYHPLLLALPDSWSSWYLPGVLVGLKLIRRLRPEILWSTFPIATAHLIALTLHRLTGIPWIADFRDSMTENGYPSPRLKWNFHRWLERQVIRRCTRAVFTTSGAKAMYAQRYPGIAEERWILLENGYDENDFVAAEALAATRTGPSDQIVLVHSGVIYPRERDPLALFSALGKLRSSSEISPKEIKIILRASGHETYLRKHILEYGLDDIVFLEPSLPYRMALSEMISADALLLLQGSSCNHQVPAKLYEYLRSRRPILALTDPSGDTAAVLRDAGIQSIVPLDSSDQIAAYLPGFLSACRKGTAEIARPEVIAKHSRRLRTQALAAVLDSVCNQLPK